MGFNSVAVIYNDFTHRLHDDDGAISRNIATAMQNWSRRKEDTLATWFHAGQIVSQATIARPM